jgi:hypothetical protein
MAPKATAAKQQQDQQALLGAGSAGLATIETGALAPANDEFDVSTFDGDDGLSEVDESDIKVPLKVWNMKGIDPATQRQILADTFYDTVTEEISDELVLVFLDLHKSNEWREYIEAEKRTVIHCKSADRVTGTMSDGSQRSCSNCEDAKWRTDSDGKRSRRCQDVHTVAALEVETERLCVLRFKSTSLSPWRQHLNKHHLGRMKDPRTGKVKNIQLIANRVKLTLKMAPGGVYAVPMFERLGLCSVELGKTAVSFAEFYKNVARAHLEKQLEKAVEPGDAGEGGDTSFNPADFVDAPGESVPAGGGASSGFSHE